MIASLTYTVVYVVIVGITRVAAVAARWPGSALNGQKRTSTCRRPPLNPSKVTQGRTGPIGRPRNSYLRCD